MVSSEESQMDYLFYFSEGDGQQSFKREEFPKMLLRSSDSLLGRGFPCGG